MYSASQIPPEIFHQTNIVFQEAIEIYLSKAAASKYQLLNLDLANIEEARYDKSWIVQMYEFFQDFVFYPDKDVKQKLIEMGFKNLDFRFFVSREKVIEQFEKIEASGFTMLKFQVFDYMKIHLEIQAGLAFLAAIRPPFKHNRRITFKHIVHAENFYRRMKDGRASRKNSEDEIAIENQIDRFDNFVAPLIGVNVRLIDVYKGKTEKLLLTHILNECIFYNEERPSMAKLLYTTYDLFSLVMPLPHYHAKNSEYYSGTEKTFKAKTLRKKFYS